MVPPNLHGKSRATLFLNAEERRRFRRARGRRAICPLERSPSTHRVTVLSVSRHMIADFPSTLYTVQYTPFHAVCQASSVTLTKIFRSSSTPLPSTAEKGR